jgi:hypothetical protein
LFFNYRIKKKLEKRYNIKIWIFTNNFYIIIKQKYYIGGGVMKIKIISKLKKSLKKFKEKTIFLLSLDEPRLRSKN